MEKYIKLVRRLREEPEATIMNISRRIKVPKSTISSWMKRLKNDNVVKNRLIVNFNEFGYHTKIVAALKADGQKRAEIEEYLRSHSNTNTVCRISGEHDVMFEAVFRNQLELKEFMDALQLKFQINDISSYQVIDELKKEEFSKIE